MNETAERYRRVACRFTERVNEVPSSGLGVPRTV